MAHVAFKPLSTMKQGIASLALVPEALQSMPLLASWVTGQQFKAWGLGTKLGNSSFEVLALSSPKYDSSSMGGKCREDKARDKFPMAARLFKHGEPCSHESYPAPVNQLHPTQTCPHHTLVPLTPHASLSPPLPP